MGKVGRIVFYPFGYAVSLFVFRWTSCLWSYQSILTTKILASNLTELTLFARAGLSTPILQEPVSFDLTWGRKQMNAFLRDLFPRLFTHFAQSCPEVLTIPSEADDTGTDNLDSVNWPYVLISSHRNQIKLLPTGVDHSPTAQECFDKSTNRSSQAKVWWKERTIHFGTFFSYYYSFYRVQIIFYTNSYKRLHIS
jgi:hypothetical protein